MVPNGWVKAAIKQFGDISAGRQRSPKFTEGAVRPYLRVANVFEAFIDTSDVNEMPFTDKEFERYKLEPGDILLNEGQSAELVGRPAMYQGEPVNCCFQNTLVRFKANDQVNSNYALQRFLLCLYDGTFQSISKKTTSIAHLGVSRFADLQLAWPPLPEQKKIAQILSTWDNAISTAETLLGNSQQQKKALMQQLLTGKKRLLDKNGVRFIGEWESKSLGTLIELLSGFAFKSSEFEKGAEYKLLRGINISQGFLRWSEDQSYSWSDGDTYHRYKLEKGDVVISMDGSLVGRNYAMITEDNLEPMLLVQRVARLRCLKALSADFLLQHIASDRFKSYVDAVKTITAIPHISAKDIRDFPMPIPPLDEQQKIATVLTAADHEISALQQKLGALKQEKKALMQQLLTGKRRVKLN